MTKVFKPLSILIIILSFLSSSIYSAYACTSFAVYSDEIIYGMNFDFHKTEVRYIVGENKGTKVFVMQFLDDANDYTATVWMNDKGLFSSCQMQNTAEVGKTKRSKDELFMYELPYYNSKYENVEQMLKFLESKRLVHWGVGQVVFCL